MNEMRTLAAVGEDLSFETITTSSDRSKNRPAVPLSKSSSRPNSLYLPDSGASATPIWLVPSRPRFACMVTLQPWLIALLQQTEAVAKAEGLI
jgi:hypothetical protein